LSDILIIGDDGSLVLANEAGGSLLLTADDGAAMQLIADDGGAVTLNGEADAELVLSSEGPTFGIPSGGSAGQILAKVSGADYDAGWVPAPSGGPGGVSDGDKGDIVVSGDGAIWLLDPAIVAAIASKANASHVHLASEVTDFNSEVDVRILALKTLYVQPSRPAIFHVAQWWQTDPATGQVIDFAIVNGGP
jgi:hypothetical protein